MTEAEPHAEMTRQKQPPPVRDTDPNATPETVTKALLRPVPRPSSASGGRRYRPTTGQRRRKR